MGNTESSHGRASWQRGRTYGSVPSAEQHRKAATRHNGYRQRGDHLLSGGEAVFPSRPRCRPAEPLLFRRRGANNGSPPR